ncbi:kelch-like protein 8 [Uloborus diversus]|uniref:kelch-like protein 8 n=1 Tax=Uloborus diversus TaxID=327109 RepID=UPI00240A5CA9|nr:kelch-like protein 8 [Uloborus diversus]
MMGDLLIEEADLSKRSVFEVSGMLQTSFNKLFEFLEKGILCDVVIQAGSKSIKCHRNVLASCSPYFQAMFTSPLAESKQHVITIGDIDETTMEMLIKFAYTAKIELNTANAQALLHAASVLQLDALAQACCEFMNTQLHPSNCLGIRQLAHQLGQSSLIKNADEYTLNHFRQVILEEEYLSISVKHLEEIISSSDLFVDNEIEVYEAMMLWVKHDVDKRREYLPKLLSNVHLPLLPLSYLRMYVESDSLIRKSLECRDLLDEARHYQMWQVSHLPNGHLPVNKRTRPRKSYAGIIFCVGGRGWNGSPFASVEFYSSFYNKWVKLNDMSTHRRHVGCVSLKGKIYAVGGCDENVHLASAEVLDLLTNKWSMLSSMSTPRRGLGLCSMGGPIYAVGGLDDTVFYSTVERYDVSSDIWNTVAPMNCARGGVAVVNLKGLMYALGGNSGPESLKTCEVYDPHLDKWTFIASMNQCRAGAGAVVVDGFIYVIGGFEYNVSTNSVEKYDPDNDKWSFVSPMKFCRGGVGAATLGGCIYAIGGHNGSYYLNTVEIYDVELDRWKMGENINDCRAGAGVTWCSCSADYLSKLCNNSIKEENIT